MYRQSVLRLFRQCFGKICNLLCTRDRKPVLSPDLSVCLFFYFLYCSWYRNSLSFAQPVRHPSNERDRLEVYSFDRIYVSKGKTYYVAKFVVIDAADNRRNES